VEREGGEREQTHLVAPYDAGPPVTGNLAAVLGSGSVEGLLASVDIGEVLGVGAGGDHAGRVRGLGVADNRNTLNIPRLGLHL
jgi:hypothetical protein